MADPARRGRCAAHAGCLSVVAVWGLFLVEILGSGEGVDRVRVERVENYPFHDPREVHVFAGDRKYRIPYDKSKAAGCGFLPGAKARRVARVGGVSGWEYSSRLEP